MMGEWKKYKLKDVCTILGDGLHGTPIYDDKGEFFFINGNNLKDGRISIKNDTKRVPYSEANKYKKPLNNRTILVSINGTIGNVAKYQDEKCILGKSACFFNVKENVDLNFIYYVVANQQFKNTITQLATGTTIKNVSLETMRNYTFCIPPLSIQKQIGKILSSLDDKIELNRRINDNLEQQAQALFKSWFVNFEPFKNGQFVDSELGKIPKGWKVGYLSEIADIIMGQSPNGSTYNENGEGIIFYQGRAEFGTRFPSIRLFTTNPTRIAPANSILISVRAPVGDINITHKECCIGRGLASAVSRTNKSAFLLYTLFSLKSDLDRFNAEGTVFGSINRKALETLKILIPTNDIISKFEAIVASMDQQILILHIESENLKILRDTLLPKLMSGERSVIHKENNDD